VEPVPSDRTGEAATAKTRFKRWWTLCGAPIEAVSGVDFDNILRARESEDIGVSAMAALLGGLKAEFGGNYFTATDVENLPAHFAMPDGTSVWTMPFQSALEEASGKPFPRTGPDARAIGKRLGMVVGRPVDVDNGILTLERTPDPKRGNAYRVREQIR
jgi:hypothetical protein